MVRRRYENATRTASEDVMNSQMPSEATMRQVSRSSSFTLLTYRGGRGAEELEGLEGSEGACSECVVSSV